MSGVTKMRKTWLLLFLAGFLMSVPAYSQSNADRPRPNGDVWAPLSDAERAIIENRVITDTLKTELRGSRYRIFATQATAVKTDQGLRRYAYTLIYDYTQNKTYNVVSDVTEKLPGKIVEVMKPSTMPPPSKEEYAEAMELVRGLERVKLLLAAPSVKLQESFPVDSPSPCDVDRCVEIQVSDIQPGGKNTFLLLITVNLSRREITEVREPSTSTSR